ncbi:MAG: MarR family transcriptional regulator [Candidatus Moraniibacteriota bacterium]
MKTPPLSSPIEPIICLAHRIEAIADTYVFKPMGISAMSMKILQLLKNHESLTPSDLIQMLHSTKSNISQRLNFLEKEKYITRIYASDEADKRKVAVRLTLVGKRMISTLEKRFRKAHISFEKKFTEREIAQHRAFIKKLTSIIESSENEFEKIFKL